MDKTLNGDDVRVLHAGLRIETLQKEIDERKRTGRRAWATAIIMFVLLLTAVATCFVFVHRSQTDAVAMIENNRMNLVQGLYTVSKVTAEEITSRDKRIEAYFKTAKRIVLERNPKTDFTDTELNEFLRVNWELSEYYMWSPYVSLAYAAMESDFTKKATSFAGAQGVFQWFPFSMHEVLGDLYIPGMERNPLWSLKAWYKRTAIGSEVMDHDFLWTACYYILPTVAVSYKRTGKTVDQFMKRLVELYPGNDPRYPWKIKELYEKYNSMS
jgi:hypothetical protein